MSVWALGRVPPRKTVIEAQSSDLEKFIGKVLKWVPADLAVLYTAFIKAVVDSPDDETSIWLTVVFVALAPITVLLVAFSSKEGVSGKTLVLRAVLALPAMAIWSATVPDSGWDEIAVVADNPAWTAGIAALTGFIFSLVAEGVENRID